MANLQRLIRRPPEVVEVDPELEARVRARLASMADPGAAMSSASLAEPEDDLDLGAAPEAGQADLKPDPGEPIHVPIWSAAVEAVEPDPVASGAAVEAHEVTADTFAETILETAPEIAPVTAPEIVAEHAREIDPDIAATPAAGDSAVPSQRAQSRPGHAASDVVRVSRAGGRGGASQGPGRRPGAASAVAACPYCAGVLEPPPTTSRRCPRCRQRIVVKRLADRAIYLTEAAVPVFDAERRKLVHSGRWTKERARWLDLALTAGAPADRIARLARDPISENVVAASRTLYVSTVDRSFRVAKRDRRWEEASRIRFDQALALHRLAGSRVAPQEEVVRLHREGLAAMLRGIAEIARSAELRAGTCCEPCQADDGQIVRIAGELRSPRLPHPMCPKVLCRCRWYLAEGDRAIVTTLLKRQGRAHRRRTEPHPPVN